MRFLILAAVLSSASAAVDCPLTNGTWPPAAWPSVHTRTEMMYTPLTGPQWSRKPIFYDYPSLRYRADSFYLSGPSNPITTLFNFTSYWFNTSLYMITYADSRSLQNTSCIILNLGITMMRPDWMTDQGGCMGDVWVTSKSNGFDMNYYRSVWTRIDALPGTDDGNFDWFSSYESGTGLMMQAPGQNAEDYVVNEESQLLPASFGPTDPVFTIPASILPTCIPVGEARSFSEAKNLVEDAGMSASMLQALPEVRLAYLMAEKAKAASK